MNAPILKAVLSRFADTEVLVPVANSSEFQANLAGLASSEYGKLIFEGQTDMAAASDDFWGENEENDWKRQLRPYNIVNGILQIPIRGVLLNNFPYQLFGYATGYAYIWEAYKRGMADEEVKGIALVCHSGGGEVAGNFDLVDRMYAFKGTKPVRGFAHEYAYSACYSIISVADHIVVSRSGGVGSIGVVTSHVDMSKMYDDIGWKVTFTHYGAHKVDGNPYKALPDDVKQRIQRRIDAIGMEFDAIVARNRGMELYSVTNTQALTYPAKEAIEVGLADSIGPLDEALAVFEGDINQQSEDEQMSKDMVTTEAHTAAVAAARAEGHAAGAAEGSTLAKTRISTILGSDTGKARPKAAMHVAMNSDMTPEQAETFLSGLDAETPAATPVTPAAGAGATQQSFTAAMATDKPNVGADEDLATGDTPKDNMAELARSHGIGGF